jgi:hypothetical protein
MSISSTGFVTAADSDLFHRKVVQFNVHKCLKNVDNVLTPLLTGVLITSAGWYTQVVQGVNGF